MKNGHKNYSKFFLIQSKYHIILFFLYDCQLFLVSLQADGNRSVQDILKIKKRRYAYLVDENLRNFQMSKDSIVVLTL